MRLVLVLQVFLQLRTLREVAAVVLALSCFAAPGPSVAQRSGMTLNGAGLLEACTRVDYEWIGFCNGYIQAAFDANSARICAPRGITRNKVYDIIISTLQQTPELLKFDAISAVGAILGKAYPCK